MNENIATPADGGGRGEMAFAIIVCVFAMFLPVVIIQDGYDAFTAEHGIAKEGAAGATLALAVVLRTVSRTILRTIVRTSARAGLKAGVKGAVQGAARVATRNLFASIFRSAFGKAMSAEKEKPTDPAGIRKSNLKSLLAATGLLYASWVIVIGLGQPFATLMTAEQASASATAELERVLEVQDQRPRPENDAWTLNEEIKALRVDLAGKRKALKGAREIDLQGRLRTEIQTLNWDLDDHQHQLTELLILSGNRMSPPVEKVVEELEPTAFDDALEWLFTRAPFPGEVSWSSPVIWAGAGLFCIPLWFIFFVQSGAAKKEGVILRHETGPDGGAIQLYFAGAFSYMPLSSDVIVEGSMAQKGRVSLVGLIAPTLVSIALWAVWKSTGLKWVLLASDAFLIYPMIQSFPLAPLDGVHVWRWRRGVWCVVFAFVMGAFLFMGSEGLKNVI
jgi:hypothetical protein